MEEKQKEGKGPIMVHIGTGERVSFETFKERIEQKVSFRSCFDSEKTEILLKKFPYAVNVLDEKIMKFYEDGRNQAETNVKQARQSFPFEMITPPPEDWKNLNQFKEYQKMFEVLPLLSTAMNHSRRYISTQGVDLVIDHRKKEDMQTFAGVLKLSVEYFKHDKKLGLSVELLRTLGEIEQLLCSAEFKNLGGK